MTRDIYQVMKELGHTKVTTTQIYTEFEDTIDIEKEFPSIVNSPNQAKFGIMDTDLMDTNQKGNSIYRNISIYKDKSPFCQAGGREFESRRSR